MKRKTFLPALLTMILWGALFPLVKMGFATYGADTVADILLFAGLRFVLCGGVICLFAALRGRENFRPVVGNLMPILLAGVFSIVLHYSFCYIGLHTTDSSKTALLKQAGALFYICFSFLFFREDRPTAAKLLAAALGLGGILVLNAAPGGISFSLGDLLILLSSFCTVAANVISKRVFQKTDPVTATGVSQLFGGVALTVVGRIMGGRLTLAGAPLWILLCICAASVVSYCLWYGIVKNGELSRLFIVKFAEPAFACVFGALLLGEELFSLRNLAAFLLIGLAVVLANSCRKTEKS